MSAIAETETPFAELRPPRRRRRRAAAAAAAARVVDEIRPPGPATPTSKRPVDLETVSARWRLALDAAEDAFRSVNTIGKRLGFKPAELGELGSALAAQRQTVSQLLDESAREQHVQLRRRLSAPRATARMLGLPPTVVACVFALDGVLTASAAVQAAAWAETFDELLSRRVEQVGERFAPYRPFDLERDYVRYLHGKPRLEGVQSFLASRGIRLPEGAPDDSPDAETVHGLANRKREALVHRLDREGVRAFAGARAYLETAREAGLPCAVVSSSAHAGTILERAGLDDLVPTRIDGEVIAREGLRAKPAPDAVLAACGRLGVEPGRIAVFETTVAGIEAARAAGAGVVVGVDGSAGAPELRLHGAHLVVADLAALVDPALAA